MVPLYGSYFSMLCTGTGKTLMARQIGKMLHAREPKIINGPGEVTPANSVSRMFCHTLSSYCTEVLNKYVGESEANIR